MLRVRRRLLVTVPLLVLVAGVLLRLEQVHQETWEWRLTHSATPPKLHVFDRDYRRMGPEPVPPGAALLATAPGGAEVFSKRLPAYVPTVLWAAADGRTVAYQLMGGP
ncbi:hypothetical protein [Motilibacter deserti]|uniref:Uncharacterized protein n=1 Tax=Motilibacter deserti TaxID=2714956 RepID=A0ABX0H1H5_9ACTN|nr:hypothetical protein [Motilibacter deserti]NHC15736.1 hypothetical protein [Motilibacter deserti]